jgi:beta-glucosidase
MYAAVAAYALLWLVPGVKLPAAVPTPDSSQVESRVDAMLHKLSIEEKIDLIAGVDHFNLRAMPSIGLPSIRMADGPMGIRGLGLTTAYPGGMAMAATWDKELAWEMGVALGRDARARGVGIVLAPGVNIYRAPMAGRNFEYMGEDPVLAGTLATAFIRGVQSQGVIATVKHFAANNQEYNRHEVSSDLDARTLHELYLPAFEMAVKEGKAGAVMDAYNPVNGIHATQNRELNCKILKGELGFDGILMSDWGATHSTIEAANACLDIEMPSPEYFSRAALLAALRAGTISEATIDDKVRRILRKAQEFGFVGRTASADSEIARYSSANRVIARKGALASLVLLKNEGVALPLERRTLKSLAVIGPTAAPADFGAGGSSRVAPAEAVSTLSGILNAAPEGLDVVYDAGLPDVAALLHGTRWKKAGSEAVQAELFESSDFSKPIRVMHVQGIEPAQMKPLLGADGLLPANVHAIRFSAEFQPEESGEYLLLAYGGGPEDYASGGDSYRLRVNGEVVALVNAFEQQSPRAFYRVFTAGKTVRVEFDYLPASRHADPHLALASGEHLVSEHARVLAAHADAVVVAVGFDPENESEGKDRTFELPFGQELLIQTLAKLNRRTAVVVTAGGGVDMHGWIEQVPAVLYQPYPGQEGGTVLAQTLFGDRVPEGKLPFSIERTWEENPVHDSYYPVPRKPAMEERSFLLEMGGVSRKSAIDRAVVFREGLMNGYRYYSTADKRPLFPFGYGLSYTRFSFERLTIGKADATGVDVTFDLTNTGDRAGSDVAQLYLGLPSTHVSMPRLELKAFSKVRLDPGERRRITLHVTLRGMSYYDAAAEQWKLDTGMVRVHVGDSAETLQLSGSFELADK